MQGNPVTQDIFGQADLKVLNVWGDLLCSPHRRAAGKRSADHRRFRSRDDTYARAQGILSQTGEQFTNLLICDGLEGMMEKISVTPTTIFIRGDGFFAAESVGGAYMDTYKQTAKGIPGE